MIKSLLISIWAILVTSGVVFAPALLKGSGTEDGPVQKAMVDHRSDTMSAALFSKGKVVGHFTTRLRYQLPDGEIDPEQVPIDQIIQDGLFELMLQSKAEELSKLGESELAEMAEQLTEILNERSTPLNISNLRFESARLMLKSAIR